MVSKQIDVGFTPLFGTWRVDAISHCESTPYVESLCFYLFNSSYGLYYLFLVSLCCVLLLSIVNCFCGEKKARRFFFCLTKSLSGSLTLM